MQMSGRNKRFVVAVSGGIDSVVLLDMLVKLPHELLVVAHFDHGIREESADDARFVAGLARRYGLAFEARREELGGNASEDRARQRRYEFLRDLAKKYDAEVVTAHHADDLIESVVINLQRGTGWRGLAVFGDMNITRPLVTMGKDELYSYACRHRLEWVEDATNQTAKYLRNRVRQRIGREIDATQKQAVRKLWGAQRQLVVSINDELAAVAATSDVYSRHFMTMISLEVAIEILRQHVVRAGGPSLLWAQAERGVLAIRVAQPATAHDLARGVRLVCKKQTWSIQLE